MELERAIRERRSIRKYKEAQIPAADITKMLEAAMMCPSACNRRAYEFAVTTDREKAKQIAEISPNFHMAESAACVIVVCGRPDLEEGMGHEFWEQDCSAATQNLLLQAYGLGYGTCWCGTYPVKERVDKVRKMTGIQDENVVPFAVITVGVPAESPAARGFYEESKVRHF